VIVRKSVFSRFLKRLALGNRSSPTQSRNDGDIVEVRDDREIAEAEAADSKDALNGVSHLQHTPE